MLSEWVGEEVEIHGWLYNKRSSGGIQFLQIRDGTGLVQGVVVKDEVPEAAFAAAERLTQESSIRVRGIVREDRRAPTGYELQLTDVEIAQLVEAEYPIGLKEHGSGFLMDHRHLWIRSPKQAAILRIRHTVMEAIRTFFNEQGFIATEAPILTPTSVEGTTTLFETDYFDDKAYLTQSGQLYLEATIMALGRVYWIGPVFRAEKSKTRKHLTEFWMAEAEVAYCDHEENLKLQEALVRYIVENTLERRRVELDLLDRDVEGLRAEIGEPFARIDYDEAIEILQREGSEIQWGEDFGAPEEEILGRCFSNRPVFIERFPTELKPFYMALCPDDERFVLAADLIAPEGYGELIGGSQRLDDLERLERRLEKSNLPRAPYEWYLDLRRYGSVPHAGFGLGVERTIAWICGVRHLRETIPFPRQIHRIYP
ncbi:MAG: asparagine--tRNA ligase [Candidatus Bipolaricaulia bacterium]